MRTQTVYTLLLACSCAVLNLCTGIYIVLATSAKSDAEYNEAFWAVSIVGCLFYGFAAIADLISCFNIGERRAWKGTMVLTSLIALGCAGTVLGRAQLSTSTQRNFGSRYCSWRSGTLDSPCKWTGERALLTGFVLWISAGVVQAIYAALCLSRGFVTRRQQPLRTPMRFGIGSGDNSVVVDTPVRQGQTDSPTLSLQERKLPFRYPLARKETEDNDAFTLEKVLAVHEGSSLSHSEHSSGADRALSHHATHSSGRASHLAQGSQSSSKAPASVRFHSARPSHAQSWTSSRPNIASGLSPMPGRGRKGQGEIKLDERQITPQQSPDAPTAGNTPESKRRSSAWDTIGLALGSPSKAIGLIQTQLNNSLRGNAGTHTAHSSTSSSKSKTSKRATTGLRFHLPKHSISNLDIPAVPFHTGDTPELNMSPMTMSTCRADGQIDASSPVPTEPTTSLPGSPVRLHKGPYSSSADLSPQTKPLRPRLKVSPMKYMPDMKMMSAGRSATLPVVIGEPEGSPTLALSKTQTTGFNVSPMSMQRKRSSILDSLKPRLPEGRSLSRASWQVGGNTARQQSPTRGSRRNSRQLSPIRRLKSQQDNGTAGTRRMSDADLAFTEWDTRQVETDPAYLVDMRDSRDISGSLASPLNSPIMLEEASTPRSGGMVLSRGGFFQSPAMNYPMSPGLFDDSGRDEEVDPWHGRDVRVRSDGSIVHKETAAEVYNRPAQKAMPSFAVRSQSMQNFGLGLSSQGEYAATPRRFSQALVHSQQGSPVDVRQVVEAAGIRVSSIAAPERRLH
ncbi:hypothetical protein BCR37DRAFT_82604 [Protomyces lactucae-debilis]|uniref:Uncharacterized protein n=1 Tax=Protomyces lactucae-debilis TaxID=2754530 RepID=A0A1Y2F8M4_PROLT|nr:uncharacterized protein BCR37DRAFT_82604 [Protomyces lactucae-debilis]ORY79977.1 hypothetical protein BCR37DRAFT_82604 [Protomyces lactucae-debilis]